MARDVADSCGARLPALFCFGCVPWSRLLGRDVVVETAAPRPARGFVAKEDPGADDRVQADGIQIVAQAKARASKGKRSKPNEEEKQDKRVRRKLEQARLLENMRADARLLLAHLRESLGRGTPGEPIVVTAFDVEAWEQDNEKVTEVGFATVKVGSLLSKVSADCFVHRHLLIREHLELRNGKYVEDNKDNFLFGDSEIVHSEDVAAVLAAELKAAHFIVGHAVRGDISWLRKIGVDGLEAGSELFERRLVDTQSLAYAVPGVTLDWKPQLNLRSMARSYGLDPQRLHNAANDAAYTLQVMLRQCGVVFELPKHAPSQHTRRVENQSLLDEALLRLDETQRICFSRELELRAEVEGFVRRLQSTAVNGEEPSKLLRFPPELDSRERKIVHQAAEGLGIPTISRADGPNGERCVTIFQPGALPDSELSGRARCRSKRKCVGSAAEADVSFTITAVEEAKNRVVQVTPATLGSAVHTMIEDSTIIESFLEKLRAAA